MKMIVHENTGLVYLRTQTIPDLYTLGRIAAKFNVGSYDAEANPAEGKEITLLLNKVIEELAK